ncbi:MAG: YceI family protein [Parahaliea sp.]
MTSKKYFAGWLAVLGLSAITTTASAQWDLDSTHSELNYVSVKNNAVAEMNGFQSLVGYISKEGQIDLTVDLASVTTNIDLRDERMRSLFFETDSFPAATITGKVAPELLAALEPGAVISTEIQLVLSLHGQQADITAPVMVATDSSGHLRVVSSRAVLLNVSDFGLLAGVAKLQEVAGLKSIDTVVPITFHLLFKVASPD